MALVELMGLFVAGVSAAALMNFLLKQVSRDYIKKISQRNPEFTKAYRSFMQFIVRNHRYFGMAAGILLVAHAGSAILSGVYSPTGTAAGVLLLATVGIGSYGFFIRKSPRGPWIHVHRGAAFLFAASAIVHIIYGAPFTL